MGVASSQVRRARVGAECENWETHEWCDMLYRPSERVVMRGFPREPRWGWCSLHWTTEVKPQSTDRDGEYDILLLESKDLYWRQVRGMSLVDGIPGLRWRYMRSQSVRKLRIQRKVLFVGVREAVMGSTARFREPFRELYCWSTILTVEMSERIPLIQAEYYVKAAASHDVQMRWRSVGRVGKERGKY